MRGIYETRHVVRLLASPHRRFRGLKQNEIADALRISRQAVSRHLVNTRSRKGRKIEEERDAKK